jgi:hypothetical protein
MSGDLKTLQPVRDRASALRAARNREMFSAELLQLGMELARDINGHYVARYPNGFKVDGVSGLDLETALDRITRYSGLVGF